MSFTLRPSDTYGNDILSAIKSFQGDAKFTDFKIKVKDNVIECHKVILAASCPYFMALFESNMKECSLGEVQMDTLDFDILHKVIKTLYGEQTTFPCDEIEHVVEICDLLQVKMLSQQLEQILHEQVSIPNCIGLYKLAEKFNFTSLGSKAKTMMRTEFDNVSKEDEFKELELAEIIDYIKDVGCYGYKVVSCYINLDAGCYTKHNSILGAVVEWIKHSQDVRKDLVIDVLKHVRLEQCSSSALDKVIQENGDLFIEADVKIFLHEVFLRRLSNAAKREKEDKRRLVVIGGMEKYDRNPNAECWSLNWENLEFEKAFSMPEGVMGNQIPMVCLPNGFAVLCGGANKKQNKRYNYQDKKWVDLPDSPVGMVDARAVLCDGCIFLFDGKKADYNQLNSVHKFNLTSEVWTKVPSLPVRQYWPIVAASGNSIYSVFNDNSNELFYRPQISLHSYRNGADNWIFKGNLPSDSPSTFGAAMVALDGCLYIVGGACKINARYSIKTNTWCLLSPPLYDHRYGSACLFKGRIYLCGGGVEAGSDVMEEYDVKANAWKVSKVKLPQKLTFLTMGVVDFI